MKKIGFFVLQVIVAILFIFLLAILFTFLTFTTPAWMIYSYINEIFPVEKLVVEMGARGPEIPIYSAFGINMLFSVLLVLYRGPRFLIK